MKKYLGIAVCLLWAPLAAGNDDLSVSRYSPWYLDGSQQTWVFEIGAEAGFEPDYPGSDDQEFEVFPELNLHWILNENWRFRLTPETLAGVVDVTDNTLVQLVIENEEGREASETEDLRLLPDGEDTVEGELSVVHRFGQARRTFAYATYQPEIQDRGKGQVWFIGLGRMHPLSESLRLSWVVDLSWGDEEHMTTEFGLTAGEASLLGLSAYDPSGGLKSSTAGLLLEWDVNEHLLVNSEIEVEYYFAEAADSPIVDQIGGQTGYAFEVSVIYRF